MTSNKKTLFILYTFYLFTFITITFTNAFMQTFLQQLGYTAMERGILLSGTAVVAIISPIIIGYLCDRFKTVKKVYNGLLILLVISTYVFYQTTGKVFFLHLIFTSLAGGLFKTFCATQDTWILEIGDYFKTRYGSIRAFGAIGWMLGCPIGSWVIAKYGYSMLGTVFTVLSILVILFTSFIPDATKQQSEKIKFSDLTQLFANKEYLLIVLIYLFINMMSTADAITVIDKMMMLGADESLVATRWSAMAFSELPLFFAGSFLLRRFGDLRLMIFGTIMYIVRFILCAFAPTPMMLVVVSMLQSITFPITMISSKTLIDRATPSHLKSSGQTVASSVYAGIPALLTPIISGFLISVVGVNNTLMLISMYGFVSLILCIPYIKIKNSVW